MNTPYPAKLFVEPTTACNLQCRMCVKQSRDNSIVEGFLEQERFAALAALFPHLDTLIFSGIGEPLLHPGLEQMIAKARSLLPADSRIGLQTNGHLLDGSRAVTLAAAGINRICISMDAASAATLRLNRRGADMNHIENALRAVRRTNQTSEGNGIQLGIEYVLMRNNLEQLPRALEQAARHGATFAIVSQMLPYDEAVIDETLYEANTDSSIDFFRKRQAAARSRGLDLEKYLSIRWKYTRSAQDQQLITFVEEMVAEATERQIPFHFRKLLAFDEDRAQRIASTFTRARECAAAYGLDLNLPALHPRAERQCEFVQDLSIFLAWDGQVYPCYMLWHQYRCFIDGREKPIASKSFGRVPDREILEIWNDPSFVTFREEVDAYEFPYCSNCNVGPCDLITNEGFEYDCFTREVPCGDCPWCMGLMQCLQ